MNSQPCLYATPLALPYRSTSVFARNVLRIKSRLLSHLTSLAILLIFLIPNQQSLTAQQAWSPGYSNNAQYTQAQQPAYAPPQPYGQQRSYSPGSSYDPQQAYPDPDPQYPQDPQQDYGS